MVVLKSTKVVIGKKLWDFCFPVPKNQNWIAVSQTEKSLMSKDFEIPMSNISVIPNGIEEQEFIEAQSYQRPNSSNTIKIGYMGQLSKRKGILISLLLFDVFHLNKMEKRLNCILQVETWANIKP